MIRATRSPELEEFAREGRRRFEAADSAWFEQTTGFGEVSSFGTAPEEQSRGRDQVLALTTDQIREMNDAAGLAITGADDGQDDDEVIEAYQAGDAGGSSRTVASRSKMAPGWRIELSTSSFATPRTGDGKACSPRPSSWSPTSY